MSMSPRRFRREHKIARDKRLRKTVRKHLSADALICSIRRSFELVGETRKGKAQIPIEDALMSAFAMFSLKSPSLLAFDQRRIRELANLKSIYRMKAIPCDTQMRTILDPLPPNELRPSHNAILNAAQRGKAFEKMSYLQEGHLMSLDGTGYFSSENLFAEFCQQKTSSAGMTVYYLQMLQGAFVHPERKEVIPLIPEVMTRQDGSSKNDCELNASRRLLLKFRDEHPHLNIVVVQDAISPNGPYIRFLKENRFRFILTVKESNHAHLFARFDGAFQRGEAGELVVEDSTHPDRYHYFRWVNGLPINASHQDVPVNLLEYYEMTGEHKQLRFCWVTDIPLSDGNVYRIMRAGRARWRIENETFNTLKNQGYHLEHNYGLGKEHLSAVFVTLMMLAFLVDQIQQLCCALFQSVLKKMGTKRALWEAMRSLFQCFKLESMEMLYRALLHGFVQCVPIIALDTS